MSTERPPVDHLAEAKTAAGQMFTDQATMYALVSIAESLQGIEQLLAINTSQAYEAAIVNGAPQPNSTTTKEYPHDRNTRQVPQEARRS